MPLLTEQPPVSGEAAGISLRRILWACDFSTSSMGALRFVIPIARAHGSEITALHVMPTAVPAAGGLLSHANPGLLQPHLHHSASICLERSVRPAIDASVPTRVELREGKPLDEILGQAARLPADLIVLGTHGESALERTELGSVAEGILGRAPCPVLAVPRRAVPPSGGLFKTVLWATDFSPHATLAWPYALALAVKGRARLLIVHVVEGNVFGGYDERTRKRRLQEAVAEGRAAGCKAEAIVTTGTASREVLRTARERAADLVVMGIQGSRALHTLFFGSNALLVVRDASCAVLAVRRT